MATLWCQQEFILSALSPLTDLQAYAETQLEKHKVPAISIAVWHNGQLLQGAAGILNQNTGVEATTDSIFRIASITKVFTTSLVMQLVDEGKVDLNAPVKTYLPDFMVADAEATVSITVRQLLNHTNALAGDFSPDDCKHQGNPIARFVDRCTLLPVIHPIGEMYSYSNTAFAIAGRLIEVVRGISWYQAMEDYIFKPLGMNHAVADPKNVLRYRAAVGHIPVPGTDNKWVFPEKDYRMMGVAPCGTTPSMSAADLITFARAHMNAGVAQSGESWLSAQSTQAMQTPTFTKPVILSGRQTHVGLGWALCDYTSSGLQTFGHTGSTGGCKSSLQILPQHNAAFAILTNGYRATVTDAVTSDLIEALTGVDNRIPGFDTVELDAAELQSKVGCYESFDTLIDIKLQEGTLKAAVEYKVDPKPPEVLALKATTQPGCFAVFTLEGVRRKNAAFLGEGDFYLFFCGRLGTRHV